LINLNIQTASDNNDYLGYYFKVGIINSALEVDANKILETIFITNQSIEESMGLETLVKRSSERKAGRYSAEQIKEPFILIKYHDGRDSEQASVYISTDIKKADIEGRVYKFDKQKLSEIFRKRAQIFYNGLCGYNNHYYYISRFGFRRSKKVTNESYLVEIENRQKDLERYIGTKLAPHARPPGIAAISNCGDILTEPSDMGMPGPYIKWFR
jgi:ribosomal protein L35AE/L33A